jgi:hypothetical protein
MTRQLLLAAALLAAGFVAQAHEFKVADIRIGHPYARATAPGQPTGGGYLKLQNRLLSATAEVSGSVELHMMKMEGDVMRMRQVDAIDVPVGQTVELKPGGYHLMFIGLKAPLKVGERFPMTLKFAKAGEVKVEVEVQAPGAAAVIEPQHKH